MSGIPAWLSRFRVTKTWAQHRASGSAGGIDFGTPAGTDILAPSEGLLSFRYFPDRSSVIRVTRADGTATEFLHGHMVGRSRWVFPNEHIGESDGRKGADGAGPSTGPHIHVHDVTARGVRVPPFSTATSTAGETVSPLEITRRLPMTARYLVAPGPIWAGIDLVAFRSVGGAIVTTVQATAEDLSRMYPFPAEVTTRDELNRSVIAARLWVEQVVNASIGGAAAVDPKALAEQLAPLLRVGDSDLTEAEFVAELQRQVEAIQATVSTIPVTVTIEQKGPGQ